MFEQLDWQVCAFLDIEKIESYELSVELPKPKLHDLPRKTSLMIQSRTIAEMTRIQTHFCFIDSFWLPMFKTRSQGFPFQG